MGPGAEQRNRLRIAAGVIYDGSRSRVLLARRPDHLHQGGLWEFPGGKLQPGESGREALARELFEELGVAVEQARPLITVDHDYPERKVRLEIWAVQRWSGVPTGREGQEIEWVAVTDLARRAFPPADIPILGALHLPSLYLITPQLPAYDGDFEQRLEHCLAAGARLVQFRDRQARAGAGLIRRVTELCTGYGARVLINEAAQGAAHRGGHGVHLTSSELLRLSGRPPGDDRLLAASCHDRRELEHARRIGVDFVVLGPVFATASHPGAAALGWEEFRRLARTAGVPVYALGGLAGADLDAAWNNGAVGIAMISGVWDRPVPERAVRACVR